MLGYAVMGEQRVQEGLSTHPCWAQVLRISEVEVLFPTFNTWGWPVRKSRTKLHRAGLRPRASSLMLSLESIMVLNAELYSMNSILT